MGLWDVVDNDGNVNDDCDENERRSVRLISTCAHARDHSAPPHCICMMQCAAIWTHCNTTNCTVPCTKSWTILKCIKCKGIALTTHLHCISATICVTSIGTAHCAPVWQSVFFSFCKSCKYILCYYSLNTPLYNCFPRRFCPAVLLCTQQAVPPPRNVHSAELPIP